MSWLILLAAIAFEVIGVPAILMFVFYLASIAALSVTLKKIEVGIAYAVWSGVGTALIAVIGIVFFRGQAHRPEVGWTPFFDSFRAQIS